MTQVSALASTCLWPPSCIDIVDVDHFVQIPSEPGRNQPGKSGEKGEAAEYQEFYDRCRDGSAGPKFLDNFPHRLSLGVKPDGTELLPFRSGSTLGGEILITELYDKLYHRILDFRKNGKGDTKGVVLTRQPGTGVSPYPDPHPAWQLTGRSVPPGKTTFLKFVLAQLISAGQAVLLCDNYNVWLFYRGKVHFRPVDSSFRSLPKKTPYCPIWALIEVDYQDHGPPFHLGSNIWPIQASSPNPIRWRSWHKQNNAALWEIPLWGMEDLMSGYAFDLFLLSHSCHQSWPPHLRSVSC